MSQRKANIDLLRIVSIYGITMFHHFGNKTPNHFVELTNNFTVDKCFYDFITNTQGQVAKTSLLMDFCYGHFGNGGNLIFMLITGYFLFGREVTLGKRVRTAGKILYAIVFYGVILTLINWVVLKEFYPFSSYQSFRPLFKLPNWISGENLWYLQAYGVFILFILPVLKIFEPRLTQQTHLYLALMLIFAHLLAPFVYLPNLWISSRILNFIMCYYVGGYLRKYNVKINNKKLILMICAYAAAYFTYEYYWRCANSIMYAPSEYSYISVMQPFICCFIYAVLLFMVANNINIPSGFPSKILGLLSSATIGIYIFHFNTISISYILADTFWWNDWSIKGYFLFIILDSFLLFGIGFFLDMIRQYSFKRVESIIDKQLLTH